MNLLPLRTFRTGAGPVRWRALLAVAVLGTAGCEDASSDPLAALLSEETHPVLSVSQELPTPPELTLRYGLRGDAVDRSVERWSASWAPDATGRAVWRLRRAAYVALAPELTRRVGAPGVGELLAGVEEALWTVDRLQSVRSLPQGLGSAVRWSSRHALEAREHLEDGRTRDALVQTLEAADHLREVAPEHVAPRLVALAEAAYRRDAASSAYTEEDRERADRLTRGARQALEGGDPVRAIRRAYYACQLLGIDPLQALADEDRGH